MTSFGISDKGGSVISASTGLRDNARKFGTCKRTALNFRYSRQILKHLICTKLLRLRAFMNDYLHSFCRKVRILCIFMHWKMIQNWAFPSLNFLGTTYLLRTGHEIAASVFGSRGFGLWTPFKKARRRTPPHSRLPSGLAMSDVQSGHW